MLCADFAVQRLCTGKYLAQALQYKIVLGSTFNKLCSKEVVPESTLCKPCNTSSTAQGGGGSFKNRKPIGEVGCGESGMAERSR